MNPHSFIRDVVFYLITIATLLYAMFIKEHFDMTLSIFFLCIYAFYVVFVLIQNQFVKKNNIVPNKEVYLELKDISMPNNELLDF